MQNFIYSRILFNSQSLGSFLVELFITLFLVLDLLGNSQTKTHSKKMKSRLTKNKWLRLIFEILIIIGIVLVIRTWQQRNLVDGIAPSFQNVLLNGKTVNLEDYHGKPVLIHFWAEWCPFCKLEEGSISSLQKDWSVLTVAYQSGDQKSVTQHMKERNIQSWPTIVDQDGRLAELFGVKGVPTSIILDGDRNIRFSEVGLTSEWGLRIRLWWSNQFRKKTDSNRE